MAVREGFLEEVLSNLILERINGKDRKVDGGRNSQDKGGARRCGETGVLERHW